MQKELEERLISLIKNPEDLSEIVMSGVTSDTFVVRREVFDFINTYHNKYRSIPARPVIKTQYTDLEFPTDVLKSEQRFLVDELIKSEIKRKAIGVLDKGTELLLNDPYGGIDYISSKLSSIKKPQIFYKSKTDGEALKRFDQMLDRKERLKGGKSIGMRTGFSFFDDKLLGWLPGNLISIVARLGIGKTFIAEYLSCFAYSEGYRVAYCSPEMTIVEHEIRWDVILGALMGYKFSIRELIRGDTNPIKYKEFLTKVSQRDDWITLDSNHDRPFTIPSIQAIVDEYSPDLLVVDGFLLLDIGGEKNWKNMLSAAYSLKNIVQTKKIVGIVTAQATRDSAGEIPEAHQVYGGDALAQASDVLITMGENPMKPKSRFIQIAKRRMDEGSNKKIEINFDCDIGKIGA